MSHPARGVPAVSGRSRRRLLQSPWWTQFGWVVTCANGQVYGFRRFRSGHVASPFSFPLAGLVGLEFLNKVEREIHMLSRAAKPKVEGGVNLVIDPAFAKIAPILAAHLTQGAWEDGAPRQLSTLTIFCGEGSWKACLRDRELSLCLWCAAKTFAELPRVLEAALGSPETVWRADRRTDAETASRKRK